MPSTCLVTRRNPTELSEQARNLRPAEIYILALNQASITRHSRQYVHFSTTGRPNWELSIQSSKRLLATSASSESQARCSTYTSRYRAPIRPKQSSSAKTRHLYALSPEQNNPSPVCTSLQLKASPARKARAPCWCHLIKVRLPPTARSKASMRP